MNKTLLIIICDFLLISILALVEFKPSIEEQLVDEKSLRDEAAEEMLELLQLSLEHESSQRKEIETSLESTREELDTTRENLDETSQSLEQVSADLQQTESERAALADSLEDTRSSLELTLEEKQAIEASLRQNEERSRRLQAELRSQQALAEQKRADLATAEENLSRLQVEQQQMATELKILDTEKQMLAQNLIAAEAEVERARIEAERARVRSESLAAGVSELAASSTALKEEIRQTQPLSMNAIYKSFEENRIFIRFFWDERGLFASNRRESAIQSLLVDTGNGIFALFATANTPIDKGTNIDPAATLVIGSRKLVISEVGFMVGEPGIAAVQVPAELARESGLKVFPVANDPLKFSNAVLVTDDRELYGEIPIRVPPGETGFLEVERKLFNRLFGEFSPTPGDYVFSMTGELTGIMVGDDRARIIDNPTFSNFLKLNVTQ
ncbi:MAG: hypothetical protein AB3N33_08425 [Puniceicoccaceae bacterium]